MVLIGMTHTHMFLGNVGSCWGRCAENAGSQWNVAVFLFVLRMGDAIHLAPLIQSDKKHVEIPGFDGEVPRLGG